MKRAGGGPEKNTRRAAGRRNKGHYHLFEGLRVSLKNVDIKVAYGSK